MLHLQIFLGKVSVEDARLANDAVYADIDQPMPCKYLIHMLLQVSNEAFTLAVS